MAKEPHYQIGASASSPSPVFEEGSQVGWEETDTQFCAMAHAKVLVQGPGGFSYLAERVRTLRGLRTEQGEVDTSGGANGMATTALEKLQPTPVFLEASKENALKIMLLIEDQKQEAGEREILSSKLAPLSFGELRAEVGEAGFGSTSQVLKQQLRSQQQQQRRPQQQLPPLLIGQGARSGGGGLYSFTGVRGGVGTLEGVGPRRRKTRRERAEAIAAALRLNEEGGKAAHMPPEE